VSAAAKLVAAAVLCTGTLMVATPTASAEAHSVPAAADWNCSVGYVCFFTGANGTGDRCQYSESHKKANEICSWGLKKPLSVWNRTSSKATYYGSQDFRDKIGSTESGKRGNLQGTYTIRSLKVG